MWFLLLMLACGDPAAGVDDGLPLTEPWADWSLPIDDLRVVVSRDQALHLLGDSSGEEGELASLHDGLAAALEAQGFTQDHLAVDADLRVSRHRRDDERVHMTVRRHGGEAHVSLALAPTPPPPPPPPGVAL